MPSWLWRAWLGPAGRGPRGLLGRRPRRLRLLPPPPEGLPDPCPCPDGPAFIVLSKPAGPGFRPGAGLQSYCYVTPRFQVPHWLRQALTELALQPLSHSGNLIIERSNLYSARGFQLRNYPVAKLDNSTTAFW